MPFSRLLSILSFRFPTSNSQPKAPSCSIPDCHICKNMLVATGDKNWAEHTKPLPLPTIRTILPTRPAKPKPGANPATALRQSSSVYSQPITSPEIRQSSSVYSQPTIPLTSLADADSKRPPPPRAHWIFAFDLTLLLLSIITLSLSSLYGHQLLHAPLAPPHLSPRAYVITIDPSLYPPVRPSSYARTWVLLYSLSMPLLTLLISLLSLLLWFARKISATLTAVVSISFVAGWMVNLGWWVECDWTSSTYSMAKNYGSVYAPYACVMKKLIGACSVLSDEADIGE